MPASPRRHHSPLPLRSALTLTAALLAVAGLTGCGSPDPASGPSPSPSSSSSSDPAGDPSPSPSQTDDASGGDADEERAQNLADAITSGNTAAIEDYLTDPTRVLIAASEADMQYSPVDAVLSIDYVQPGTGSWDFALDAPVRDAYAASPDYGQFFPEDAVVGLSDAGAVISFVPNGAKIGTIFMAIDETLITG